MPSQSYKLTDIGLTFNDNKKSHSCLISKKITFSSEITGNTLLQLINCFKKIIDSVCYNR